MRINTYGVAKYTNKIRINHDKTTIFRHRADDQSQSSRRSAGIDRRIFRYQADNSTVSCWWNFCFLLVELLFSAGETLVSSWWNSCFGLMKHPHLAENTEPYYWEYFTKKRNNLSARRAYRNKAVSRFWILKQPYFHKSNYIMAQGINRCNMET